MDKKKIARKLRSKEEEVAKVSVFTSKGWISRKNAIQNRVDRKILITKDKAIEIRNKKLKILDDKGKKHKVGEIFESETLTIEL